MENMFIYHHKCLIEVPYDKVDVKLFVIYSVLLFIRNLEF